VENASLLPWLTGTALLHSIMAQQQRGTLKGWNVSLIALTFVLCIFGTYLTRSGVIQSVHSFGQSLVGTFFFWFLVICVIGSVVLIVSRRRLLKSENSIEGLLGRDGMFLATNVLLLGMTLLTLLGTIFPIISQLMSQQQITVSQNFYNKAVAPLGVLLVGLMSVGPLLTYGKDAGSRLTKALVVPAIVAVIVTVAFAVLGLREKWALICVAICSVALINIAADLVKAVIHRMRDLGETAPVAMVRLIDSNHRRYGGQIVHVGMLMIICGIVGSSLLNTKETFQLHPGQKVQFAGRTLTFEGLSEVRGENFSAVDAKVTIVGRDGETLTLHPQKRYYDKANPEEPNTEVAIESTWREDLYLSLAGWEAGWKTTAIAAISNPLVSWIWIGGLVMCLGAIVGLLPKTFGSSAPVADSAKAEKSAKSRKTPPVAAVAS
jgi:cytochrome c-type biogenesis protein CcmF